MKTKEFKKIISDQILKELEYISEHEEVKAILAKVEGKQFNGKTLNAKLLNGLQFVSKFGMFHIEGKFSHLIGYYGTEAINVAKFLDYDACHGSAAQSRISQLQNIDIEKMVKIFTKIENHFNGLRAAFGEVETEKMGSYHNPVYYSLLRQIQGYKDENNKIRLTDFYFIRK